MDRPKSFSYRLTDPWDGALVCSGHVTYDPRMAAKGCYTRWLLRMKAAAGRFASPILNDRTPRVGITFHR